MSDLGTRGKVLGEDGRDKGAGRSLAFRAGDVNSVQTIEVGGLQIDCEREIEHGRGCPQRWRDGHTSYPILRHHSIISEMACPFIFPPDKRIALTTEALDCSELRALTASCNCQSLCTSV